MPRQCTICIHENKDEINRELLAGTPLRKIANCFGTSPAALHRHKSGHLPKKLSKAKKAEEISEAGDLLQQLEDLITRTGRILDVAEEDGDLQTALKAIREARSNLDLLAKLQGELQQEGTTNIILAPEWVELRTVILQALEPYPEARLTVAKRLQEVEGNG